ncbi:hypothetical protein O0F86_12060, partial [Staphylococcus pseudintermedius]|nr:hypothetical protein [Staphylococcus pseudintermedius]
MILLVLTILLAFLLVNTVVNIAFDISQLKQNMDVLSRIDIAIEIIKDSLLAIIKSPLSILHFEHFKSTLLYMFPLFLLISYRFYRLYRKYRNVDWGEEGDSRWTTLKELKEQYKEIPDT